MLNFQTVTLSDGKLFLKFFSYLYQWYLQDSSGSQVRFSRMPAAFLKVALIPSLGSQAKFQRLAVPSLSYYFCYCATVIRCQHFPILARYSTTSPTKGQKAGVLAVWW